MSDDKKKNELDRREFMKRLLAGTGFITNFPAEIFLSNMMIHFLQKGYAQAAGLDDGLGDMKFVNIAMNGGLARWYWDGVITPNGNDKLITNPMVISKFKISGDSILGEYVTTPVGRYHMPHVWSGNIPTADGSFVPMSSLADNMLIMRGINTLIDSHELNKPRHIAPVVGGTSLTGLVADRAKSPMPAIQSGGVDHYFGSKKGIANIMMSGANPLNTALSPFLPGTSAPLGLKNNEIENALDLALKKISESSSGKNKYLPSSFEARLNAKNLMKKSFGDLQIIYDDLVIKYRKLISRSFEASGDLSLNGIDNIPLIGSLSNPYVVGEIEYHLGNVQTITDYNTSINNLAESFAVAEYMLTEGLSSSVNLVISEFTNLHYEKTINEVTGKITGSRRVTKLLPDAHASGSFVGLVMYSRYYRAVSACLYEFIQKLKQKQTSHGNMFNQTTISLTSEFNRCPLKTGKGSDHGWDGSVYSVFSGMIDELTIIGNVKLNVPGHYTGTWGAAAPVSELGEREALLGNAISTIASMTEVPTPTPNDMAFVVKVNGKIRPIVKSVKNIDSNSGEEGA